MSVRHFLIGIAMLATSGVASAGPIYRIVGPDGKVTFSDKPPAEASTQDYEVVHGQSAPTAPGKAAPTNQPAPTGTPGAQRAVSGNLQSSAPTTDPGLESAVSGVLSTADFVRQTQAMCANTLPAARAKYEAIVQHWQERNGAVIARAREVLQTRFDTSTRQSIEAAVRKKNEAMFTPVAEAPVNNRVGWCDKSIAAIDGGTMDVHNNPKLAGPLAK